MQQNSEPLLPNFFIERLDHIGTHMESLNFSVNPLFQVADKSQPTEDNIRAAAIAAASLDGEASRERERVKKQNTEENKEEKNIEKENNENKSQKQNEENLNKNKQGNQEKRRYIIW